MRRYGICECKIVLTKALEVENVSTSGQKLVAIWATNVREGLWQGSR